MLTYINDLFNQDLKTVLYNGIEIGTIENKGKSGYYANTPAKKKLNGYFSKPECAEKFLLQYATKCKQIATQNHAAQLSLFNDMTAIKHQLTQTI